MHSNIKQANIQNLEELTILFEGYRDFYKKELNAEAARDFLAARIDNQESIIYVAFDEDDKMCGFTQLYPLFSSTRMKRLWLLNDLFVSPTHRGKGYSKQLIERAKQLARDTQAAGLMLETAKTNDIGNQLYPATDFELDSDFNWYSWTTQ